MTVCNKFEPTILEGQLCYSLDIAKLRIKTKPGKPNGLFLLLDPNPFPQNATEKDTDDQSFKVYIHTLGQYTTFAPGSYGMSTLKRMTGTKGFKQLPNHQKECMVHSREECQTQKYLAQVQGECKCTPWDLEINQGKNQVKIKSFKCFSFCRCLPFAAQRRKAAFATKL